MHVGCSCPICGDDALPVAVPVGVRRRGWVVLRLAVPAFRCPGCGHVEIDDDVQEQVIATLEQRSEPGDEIVFPSDL